MNEAVIDSGGPSLADSPAVAEVPLEQVRAPEPLSSQTPVAEKPVKVEVAEKTKPTVADALKSAREQVKAKEAEKAAKPEPVKAEAKPEAKPVEAKSAREHGPDGKFVPKEQPATQEQVAQPVQQQNPNSPHREAPSRFSPDAKAAWETAPEPVKAEVHRAIKELEQGHQKYRESADAYEQVRQFDELAKKNGGNLKVSLERVVELENAFARGPIEGLTAIADHFGFSLRGAAAHIMGQTPDAVQQQTDTTVSTLKNEIASLKQQLSGVTQTIQQQVQTTHLDKVQSFAADHPRFEELSEDIAFFLEAKRAHSLQEAYELAERLNPAPAQAFTPAATVNPPAKPTPAPLNQAGQKSITGSPANGSNPSPRKGAAPSIRDALRQASAHHR